MDETYCAPQRIQAGGYRSMKTEEYADLVIPELEEAPLHIRNSPWTALEDAILERYYMTRSIHDIASYFAKTDIPRTASAISSRASVLGLTTRRPGPPCQKK